MEKGGDFQLLRLWLWYKSSDNKKGGGEEEKTTVCLVSIIIYLT
jgi:hypothetical protein